MQLNIWKQCVPNSSNSLVSDSTVWVLDPTIHILFERLGIHDNRVIIQMKACYTLSIKHQHVCKPRINISKSIKWKWKVDMKSFRKYGFIRKLRTHMVYSLQDHANCVVCYIQYMTPSHHLTSKHYSWWYIVSNTRIWPGKKAVATREPCVVVMTSGWT